MADEGSSEGSQTRRLIDLNLYVGLHPLPPSRVWLETSAASPASMPPNSTGAAPEAPRTAEPEQSLTPAMATGEPENDGSCGCNVNFQCNICLDVAKEPVVTSCGHLFCWPCLYRWIQPQSPFADCPVCKGEVRKGNITPIYGRGSEEGDSAAANPGLPPRPPANRRESLRQVLQMAGDTREIESEIRQLIQIQQGIMRGLAAPARTEMASVPAAWGGTRRQLRQDNTASRSMHSAVLNVGNVASEGSNQNQLPHSMEQLPTPSTAAAVVGEPGPSRRSRRPSESPTIRRSTRRRLQ